MTRVLGVHGIGKYHYYRDNGRSPESAADAISAEWSQWLLAGQSAPNTVDLRVAYYAQYLHRGTAHGSDDPATLEPGAQDLLVSWVELLQPRPQIAMGPRSARVRQAADWLTRHAGPAARVFALAFCREVHTYLSKPDSVRRRGARCAVASAIAQHRPDVVVAHSLGSVVTYETLWEHPFPEVALLVTIGSPLAMPGVVFSRLQPELVANRGARPPGVARWVNLADVGDIVAIPRGGLASHFDGVDYDADVIIGGWDFHTVENYLACPELRQLIAG